MPCRNDMIPGDSACDPYDRQSMRQGCMRKHSRDKASPFPPASAGLQNHFGAMRFISLRCASRLRAAGKYRSGRCSQQRSSRLSRCLSIEGRNRHQLPQLQKRSVKRLFGVYFFAEECRVDEISSDLLLQLSTDELAEVLEELTGTDFSD